MKQLRCVNNDSILTSYTRMNHAHIDTYDIKARRICKRRKHDTAHRKRENINTEDHRIH